MFSCVEWRAWILRERRWKEVTPIFSFPSTATNSSFVLRKYFVSLLHHYEQIYFFKAKGWTPLSAGACSELLTLLIINFLGDGEEGEGGAMVLDGSSVGV
uniref:ARID domain-containing protein n=1 Tax=Davidia involucrata TaxID=16924 RepID=A0A5B7BEU9_DAVIN